MTLLHRLASIVRWMIHRNRAERDLNDELEAFVDMAAADRMRDGLAPTEARRSAVLHLGGVEQAKESIRSARHGAWLDELGRDVRYALRMCARNPGFSVVVVATLAIGIGANAAVFSVVNGVLIRPLPYPDPDKLIGVHHTAQFQGTTSNAGMSSTMYLAYREHNRTFAEFGVWHPRAATVTGIGEPEEVRAVVVTYGALAAVGVRPTVGRWFSAADDTPGTPETVILGYGYWQRRLAGNPAVVGSRVTIDSRPREVIGVMPQGFRFLDVDPDVILPQRFEGAQLGPNDVHLYIGIARLKPGTSLEQASADVRRMLPIWIAEYGTNARVLTAARFAPALRLAKQDVIGDLGPVLWLLMGTIGIVLLIACANVANLLLVRAEGRRQELSVRAALGAGWRRIARQLFVESVTLGVLGGALGLALAYAAVRLLVTVGPANLPRLSEISIDPVVLVFTFGVSVMSAPVFGLMPIVKYAWPGQGLGLNAAARGRIVGHTRERHRSQNVLVVVQVALAVVLLVASGLMIRSFQALRNVNPGFARPEQILTLRISIPAAQVPEPERVVRMQQDIVDRLAEIPGVTSVTFGTALPMETEFENNTVMTAEDQTYAEGIPPLRRSKTVAPGLFDTLGIPLIAGRDFTWTDVYERRQVAIVSTNMARETWGEPSAALGKRIRIGRVGPWTEIVGVVGDVYDSGVHQAPPTTVYWRAGVHSGGALAPFIARDMTFAVRSTRTGSEEFLGQVGRAVWAVNPNLPLARVQTFGEVYKRSMSRTSFTLMMLAIAGSMALALAIVGIYGVISYAVSERRREIGIRLALGAARTGILGQFLGQGVRVAGVACLAGLALSLAATRALSQMLYGISPSDPATLSGVAAIVLLVSAFATLVPAVRAAFVEPMHVLREE
jgi:putative ABC transport system permease protein